VSPEPKAPQVSQALKVLQVLKVPQVSPEPKVPQVLTVHKVLKALKAPVVRDLALTLAASLLTL
jgi:hypothetical protein